MSKYLCKDCKHEWESEELLRSICPYCGSIAEPKENPRSKAEVIWYDNRITINKPLDE